MTITDYLLYIRKQKREGKKVVSIEFVEQMIKDIMVENGTTLRKAD